jgi:cobalt-zinc-cadmium efflux system outer membrane protein
VHRLAAIALVLGAVPAAAAPLRLADVLRDVAERGPDHAVAAAQVSVARTDVVAARMFPNPGIGFTAGRAEPVFSAALQFRLPILGQRGAHIHAAERGVEQSQAEAELAGWRLRHDARIAYYTAARAEEEVAIAVEIEALTGRVADMARERFEVGAGTRLDQEQAGLVHARALQDVSDRRAAARVARLELARLIGVAADTLGAIADELATVGPTPGAAELFAQARDRHPELRAIAKERAAALARAGAARADRRPVPNVEVGVEVLEATTCGGTDRCVGPHGALSFDLPVFNLNGGPVQRAEAEARLAELRARAAETRVDAQVRGAYENWTAATTRARFFDASYVPTAVTVVKMAQEGFANGKTGLLPLLEAERAVLEARLGRAEALFSVQAARADLEEASGVPLSTP